MSAPIQDEQQARPELSAEDVKRLDAEGFAKAVTALLVTLDVLPPDWQRRALAVLNAAYPKPERPNPLDWYSKQGVIGTLSTQPAQLGGSAQDAYAKSMASYGDGVLR